jgi:hypothetical protein
MFANLVSESVRRLFEAFCPALVDWSDNCPQVRRRLKGRL